MRTLRRGERVRLTDLTRGHQLLVSIAMTGEGVGFETGCLAVGDDGRMSDQRHGLLSGDGAMPDGSVVLTGAETEAARVQIDLATLPGAVERLVFATWLPAGATMASLSAGRFALAADGEEVAELTFSGRDFPTETALIVAELYVKDGWRLAAVAQGFAGGVPALLERYGAAGEPERADSTAPGTTDVAQEEVPAEPALPFWRSPPVEAATAAELYQHGLQCASDGDGAGMMATGWALWDLRSVAPHHAFELLTDGYREWREGEPAAAATEFLGDVIKRLWPDPSLPWGDLDTVPQDVLDPIATHYAARCWAATELVEAATPVERPVCEPKAFDAIMRSPRELVPPRARAFAPRTPPRTGPTRGRRRHRAKRRRSPRRPRRSLRTQTPPSTPARSHRGQPWPPSRRCPAGPRFPLRNRKPRPPRPSRLSRRRPSSASTAYVATSTRHRSRTARRAAPR